MKRQILKCSVSPEEYYFTSKSDTLTWNTEVTSSILMKVTIAEMQRKLEDMKI